MNPQVMRIDQLNGTDRQAAFALLQGCFDGVTRETFEHDLANKTLAVLLRSEGGELHGFSTLAMYPACGPSEEPVTIACSGDTIVAPGAWGSSTLPRTWINAALDWHATHGRGRLYWLLLTSGFRTYRFLPVFFERFYPHHAYPIPSRVAGWMHRLAGQRWGTAYDRASGIVRFAQPQRLRPPLAGVPKAKAEDTHIRHFLTLNPGHARGDELLCLCELSRDNLTRAGRRMVEAGAYRSHGHAVESSR